MSSRPKLKLDWCTHEAAKYAVENWHYSKSLPVSKSSKVGVWEDDAFIGVVIYGLGANPNIHKPYGLNQFEAAELVRVALRQHATPVSRILSVAQKFICRQSPKLRLLISYADTDQNHHGGIYQACNWIYAGMTSSKFDFVLDGQKLQRRSYTGRNFGGGKRQLPVGAEKVFSPPKHRYLMPLDDEMRAKIEPLRKPYPKRVRSEDSGTDGTQPSGGGANPTRTL